MNILIADDEKLMREDLKNAIERVRPGNDYHMAKNYDEAVKVVEAESIDIAFLDINMPGKTGLELTKTLKKMKPDINIIMVTAHADYALSAHRLFVSGYLMKPVMDDELTEALDNLRVSLKGVDKPVRVTCFGNFEIYKNGEDKIISFSRQKENHEAFLDGLLVVVGTAALLAAEDEALHQLVLGHVEFNHRSHLVTTLVEHLLQSLCLRDGAGETVEDHALVLTAKRVIN